MVTVPCAAGTAEVQDSTQRVAYDVACASAYASAFVCLLVSTHADNLEGDFLCPMSAARSARSRGGHQGVTSPFGWRHTYKEINIVGTCCALPDALLHAVLWCAVLFCSLKAVLERQDNRQGKISFIDISDPYYDPLAVSRHFCEQLVYMWYLRNVFATGSHRVIPPISFCRIQIACMQCCHHAAMVGWPATSLVLRLPH